MIAHDCPWVPWRALGCMQVLHPTMGPFVLMVVKMLKDVAQWLVIFCVLLVAFASSLHVIFVGNATGAPEPCSEIDLDVEFGAWPLALLYLFEATLRGEGAYFECARASSEPLVASILVYAFQVGSPSRSAGSPSELAPSSPRARAVGHHLVRPDLPLSSRRARPRSRLRSRAYHLPLLFPPRCSSASCCMHATNACMPAIVQCRCSSACCCSIYSLR